jgi:hypothetical protein
LAIDWYSKSQSTKVIAAKMESSFRSDDHRYSTVNYLVRMMKLWNDIHTVPGEPGKPIEIGLDDNSYEALSKLPFHNLRSLASSVKSPISTIRGHLLKTGFELKRVKWVAHSFTEDEKRSRIEISIKLLDMLRMAGHNPWNYFVTGDHR